MSNSISNLRDNDQLLNILFTLVETQLRPQAFLMIRFVYYASVDDKPQQQFEKQALVNSWNILFQFALSSASSNVSNTQSLRNLLKSLHVSVDVKFNKQFATQKSIWRIPPQNTTRKCQYSGSKIFIKSCQKKPLYNWKENAGITCQ